MRKLTLGIIAFHLSILASFAQQAPDSSYQARKLHLTEVNFVSSYYHQDGNHSAVTGGIGTEKLTDIGNVIDLTFNKTDSKQRLHMLGLEMGIDHYTSASSDKIDPATITSPSYADTRFYPSLSYSVNNPAKNITLGGKLSFSSEFDYQSRGIGFNFAKTSRDHNREFGAQLNAYLDTWDVILPIELRTNTSGRHNESSAPRDSYSGAFTLSQVVNQRLQVMLLADVVYQKGLLATSYQRVYLNTGAVRYEVLPGTRFKLPLAIKANYFLGDRFIIKAGYRFYTDDWGVRAHTADLELPVKLSSFFSISPFYRYYQQTATRYFAPYGVHTASDAYYTSDYDLSSIHSQDIGAGFRWVPEKGVFGIQKWNMLEIRYGHYLRSDQLNSNIISLNARFK